MILARTELESMILQVKVASEYVQSEWVDIGTVTIEKPKPIVKYAPKFSEPLKRLTFTQGIEEIFNLPKLINLNNAQAPVFVKLQKPQEAPQFLKFNFSEATPKVSLKTTAYAAIGFHTIPLEIYCIDPYETNSFLTSDYTLTV